MRDLVRAREKDAIQHSTRREANATEPSAVFEPASDEDVTINAVYRAECDNQDGLRFVDFDGSYGTATQTPSWTVVGSEGEWMVVHPTQDPIGPLRSREIAEAVCKSMATNDVQPKQREE